MSAVTGPAPIQEEEEEEDDAVEAEGVEDKDIELVMSQVCWIKGNQSEKIWKGSHPIPNYETQPSGIHRLSSRVFREINISTKN